MNDLRNALFILVLACVILLDGCGMLQSRREMMADLCRKNPDIIISSYSDQECEWAMSCGNQVPDGCVVTHSE